MRNFISEDDIERAILDKLGKAPFHYDILRCNPDPSKREDLNDGTMRASKRECVLPDVLLQSLKKLNPDIGEEYILETVKELRKNFTATDIVNTNYSLYNRIRNGIQQWLAVSEKSIANNLHGKMPN